MFRKTALVITLANLSAGFVGAASANLSDQWYLGAGYANSQLLPRAVANDVTRMEEIGQGATVFFGRDFDERSSGQFQLYSLGDVVFNDDSTASYTAADASLLFRFYDSRDNLRNARLGLSVYGRFGFGFIERDSTTALRTDGAAPVYFGAGGGLEAYITDMFAIRSEFIFHERDTISANVTIVARFGGTKSRAGAFRTLPSPTYPPPVSINAPDEPAQGGTQPQTMSSPVANPPASPIPILDQPSLIEPALIELTPIELGQNGTVLTEPNLNEPTQTLRDGVNTTASDPALGNPIDPTIPPNADLPEVAVMVGPQELPEAAIMVDSREFSDPPTADPQVQSDIDKDGITDDIDQCPQSNRNYPVRQNGCSLVVDIGGQIQFLENSALPLPRTELVLEQLAVKMNQFPTTRIEVIAHTDNAGAPQAKSSLTRQRLRAIGIYLVQRGIRQDRFLLRSFGGNRPAFGNGSAEGRRANNRIEIVEKP
ncbi:MAG: outer membrane protein OmpA-like peptidoglycan-associated protein [Granulosicoccus sp.]